MEVKSVRRSDFVVPPCTDACPAGVDVPRYIRAVRDGRPDEAVAILREKIPFPVVCADACFAPCEDVCAYQQFGEPIAIRAIKRYAVDHGGDIWKKRKKPANKTGKKAAIVGAGPAGLTCAYYLISKGHETTVFDSNSEPGGTMRYGIPEYRLPKERLKKDINEILELGVNYKGETVIGKNVTFEQLQKEFDAIFIATGANKSSIIPLEGTDKEGVLWGREFLREVSLGKAFDFNGGVVVVGGGNVAIDAALTAIRLGAKAVHLVCLETREEMPAHEWEVERAEEEGVVVHNCWGPQKCLLEEDHVTGLRLVKCLSAFDDSNAFNPCYEEDETSKIEASQIILAVGQNPECKFVEDSKNVNLNQGCIKVDEEDFSTDEEGLFAGGDVVSGPDSIINAIAHGRKAAAAMDKYLGGNGNIDELLAEPENEVLLSKLAVEVRPREDLNLLKPWQRQGFDQVERGLTERQAAAETNRCLECDARRFEVTLNTEYCKECGYCVEVCNLNAFGPSDSFNTKGFLPMECKSSDWCVGCLRCYFSCPDFAIDVREITIQY